MTQVLHIIYVWFTLLLTRFGRLFKENDDGVIAVLDSDSNSSEMPTVYEYIHGLFAGNALV